jgi:hypothetical protein
MHSVKALVHLLINQIRGNDSLTLIFNDMKTNFVQIKKARILFLITVVMLFFAGNLGAQNKASKEKSGKQKYSIHILKEVNGEKTTIDTTFESSDDFDVNAWVDKHNAEMDMDENLKKMEKEFKVTIPNFSDEDMKSMPDTIIVNGDTIVVNTQLKKILEDNPDLGKLGMENFFNQKIEAPSSPKHGMPPCCPFPGMNGMDQMMPFNGLNFPGLEKLLPLGNLEQIVIKKKRHGKKIIINFEDNDDDIVIRPGMHRQEYLYNDDRSENKHSRNKRIIIEKEITPENNAEEGSNVEHYKDGNKEVIIIHKK